jgi:hypothetical protein
MFGALTAFDQLRPEELTVMATGVAGGVIAFYQVGYGIAAFGVGPLESSGVDLNDIYAVSAGIAVIMGLLSFVVARRRPSLVSFHPVTSPAEEA